MTTSRNRWDAALVMVLSVAVLDACGSENGLASPDVDEPLAAAEQPAIPGAAMSQVTRTLSIAAGGALTLETVSCPSNSIIVGGGYLSANSDLRVNRSHRSGNAWLLSAINTATTSTTVDIYAECLSGTRGVISEVWNANTTIPPGGTGMSINIYCPAGTIMTGGGYQASPSFRPFRNSPYYVSTTFSNRWGVAGQNMSTSTNATVRAMVVCLGGPVTGLGNIVEGSPAAIPPGGQTIFTQAACPTGTLLSSGGYWFTGEGAPLGVGKGIRRSSSNPASWVAVLVNKDTVSLRPLVVSICLDISQ